MIKIRKPTVVEGETIEFTCVISAVHGEQPDNKERNWFHLYKNREKISSLPEPGGMGAVTFIKQDITKNDAGNYTCMYGNENPGDVKNISHGSSVYLSVRELSYQLTLQLDKHNPMEGMDVSFKCMIPAELREAAGKERYFHLYKDGSRVDSQADPKEVPGVTFSIENVKRSDTGNYTCLYGKEKLVNSANSKRSRPVYLRVTELSYQLTLQLDKHNPMEGMDVSFKCMIPAELRDAAGKEGFFHLYKNGSRVDLQPRPKGVPGVTFSIKNVKWSDTGNYTCVYGKEKLVNSANSKRSRPVYLHVTEYMTTPSQQKLTGEMTTPNTSTKTQHRDETGKCE
ncbi:obscurin-like [Polyodon spathula]|uniref:obscurin-like n=1 Tax=Polyodon spathula TaxID=7913 RepID=UPI001B7E8965|nr:obscurin-like [Polyodon spathula]